VRYYSAGMMVRLAFAIATAVEPEVLLIDEVLSVGDHAFQAKANERMKQLMSRSRLMVMVSHGMESIVNMCNRAILLQQGTIVTAGEPHDVVKAYMDSIAPTNAAHPVGGVIDTTVAVEPNAEPEPVAVSG